MVIGASELDEFGQAGHFNSRERVRSFRDVASGLFATQNFGVSQVDLDTDAYFGDRNLPITITTAIEITGAAADGLLWEFGGSIDGIKLAINSGTLYAAAGDNAGDGGVDGNWADASIDTVGARLYTAFAHCPGTGRLRVWVNGEMVIRATAVAPPLDQWAGTNNGSVGEAESGSSTTRGQLITTAPVDFALIEPCKVFYKQLPRFMD